MASTRAPLARFESASGARIYRIPVETFPGHVNNVYLVQDRSVSTLVDVGSGLPQSIEDLQGGFEALRTHFGVRVRPEAVQHVVITHSHIDHFGHVGWFQSHSAAAIYIHELDARVLQNFEERIVLASKDVRVFLERSGLEPSAREELEEMYRAGKSFFKSVRLDRKLRDGDRVGPGYVVHHVPGHCPGQICLQVDDVLFTARPRPGPDHPPPVAGGDHPVLRARAVPSVAREDPAPARDPARPARPRGGDPGPRGPDRRHRGPPPGALQPGAGDLPRAAEPRWR